jgi:hypothetical protein
MSQADALRSIYETEGRDGLVAWVAEQRANIWMEDARHDVIKRHIDLVNSGAWPKTLDPLDWQDPLTFEALRFYLSDKMLAGVASTLSSELQHLAGRMLSGGLVPRRKAKEATASTPENIRVAVDCITALKEIGINAYDSGDAYKQITGCAIVADALGERVRPHIVRRWWQAYQDYQKAAASL